MFFNAVLPASPAIIRNKDVALANPPAKLALKQI